MKECPKCNRSYADEALIYCLDDGSLLSVVYEPQPTLLVSPPRSTNSQPTEVLLSTSSNSQTARQGINPRFIYAVITLMAVMILALVGYIFWTNNLNNSFSEKSATPNNREVSDNTEPVKSAPTPGQSTSPTAPRLESNKDGTSNTASNRAGCVPAPPGLVASWPGDDNANDMHAANNGTLQNGAIFAGGKVGRAFSFDGVNDQVQMADSASLDIQQELTIAAWIFVSPDAPTTGRLTIVSKYQGFAGVRGYELSVYNKKLELLALTQGEGAKCNPLSSSDVVYGQWNHVAGTINSKQCQVYINGQFEGAVPGINSIQQNSNPLFLGVHATGAVNFFKGQIDEVELFDRALSGSEIQVLYTAGSAGKCLVAR